MTAALGGLDVLLFTGGIGEHAPKIRSRAADRLRYLGVAVDATRNAAAGDGDDISTSEARVRTFVVTAREDLEIARGVHSVLGDQSASAQPSVVADP